jgi:hypothetical protein
MESGLSKALESELGKKLASLLFGRFNTLIKSNDIDRDVRDVFDTIAPIDKHSFDAISLKVTEKYLTFRTLQSRTQDIFIGDIYHPLKIKKTDSDENIVTLVDNEFISTKIACIVGKAGQGKTTILRKMVYNHLNMDSNEFPIIITLRNIDWTKPSIDLKEIVSIEFKELGINNISLEAYAFLLIKNRIKIFFDGFDEVTTANRSKAIALITSAYSTYNCACIVTTRPGTEIQLLSGIVINYTLLDLDYDDVKIIIERNPRILTVDKTQILTLLDSKREIANILVTPIILDVFITTYPELSADPTSLIDVYEQLFTSLISTHDRLKISFQRESQSSLNVKQLEEVFWGASFRLLLSRNDVTFTESEIAKAFLVSTEKLGLEDYNTHLDVINQTSLIQADGNEYSYIHKSIIEFHAAKHILNLSDAARISYYERIASSPHSNQENVLKFLSKIDEDMFYIHYTKNLLKEINKIATLLNNDQSISVQSLLSYKFYSNITVSVTLPDGRVSFQPLKNDNDHLIKYMLTMESVLDIYTPSVDKDNLELEIYEIIKTKGFLSKYSVLKSSPSILDGDVRVNYYKIPLFDIVSETNIVRFLDGHQTKMFVTDILNLDRLIIEHKKIYDDKNSMSEFF